MNNLECRETFSKLFLPQINFNSLNECSAIQNTQHFSADITFCGIYIYLVLVTFISFC